MEKDYLVKEREKLYKDVSVLKECLDLINNLDSQLSL
jgi:hypothetical protein